MSRGVIYFLCLVLSLVVVAGIVVATGQEGFLYFQGLQGLLALSWGRVVLLDFSLSLIFTGCWVWAVEPHKGRALLLGVLIFVLGNPVLLAYLALRARCAGSLRELLLSPDLDCWKRAES
ncbi:MAG: hypothetical protein ACAI44_34925 [Candidatus Sericytochromatia bacterium]